MDIVLNNDRKSLSQQTEEALFAMIVKDKKFSPGDRLPNENVLSQMLGVSRSTLREAIRSLAAQGLLEVRRGSGTYIPLEIPEKNPDIGFMALEREKLRLKDLFETRLIIEPEMTYMACKRGTAVDIQAIIEKGQLVEDFINAGKDRQEMDEDFHFAIAKASHNESMIEMFPLISRGLYAAFRTTVEKNRRLSVQTLQDHKLIMDSIKLRDALGAKYAMMMHMRHAMQILELPLYTDI